MSDVLAFVLYVLIFYIVISAVADVIRFIRKGD